MVSFLRPPLAESESRATMFVLCRYNPPAGADSDKPEQVLQSPGKTGQAVPLPARQYYFITITSNRPFSPT